MGGTKTGLQNMVMQLRKCANHPYLFEAAEPDVDTIEESYKLLVEASGKLVLLDLMLTKVCQPL